MTPVVNVFKVPELRTKILFTLAMLAVYRIGFWIPLPGVDQSQLISFFRQQTEEGSAFGKAATFMSVFSGGSFGQSTVFGLGIMPYISASIIMQLVGTVSKTIKNLQQEGPTGRQKIQDWTRRLTVPLCLIQAILWLQFITAQDMVYAGLRSSPIWWFMAVTCLTAGTLFLMWLAEQIDRHGIGNGASMIIMAGIVASLPWAITWVINNFDPSRPGAIDYGSLALLIGGFVLVVAGSVIMTVAQRRIPIQQAKHTRGRTVIGGQRSYLPLRINHGGVMPIIFASSLMIFPSVIVSAIADAVNPSKTGTGFWIDVTAWISRELTPGEFIYVMIYIAMVYFFSYFWISVQFNPEEMSKQLREHGSFIPGLRPGPRTAEYLEAVMERITFVGAAFLSIIAVLPMVVSRALNVDFMVAQFFGGTGLLIVVSVALDFLQRIEANLMMRNYAGFLGGGEDPKAPRIRGPRG
ncbi:MAG: preprotein translocase subunit SecY [Phycisphaeraceae bacterium]|nr:preprotein translocase subunit SecY [Phycisphaeraceae bacterium]MCW5754343.1 preprotein translocase subunit SecY [Phycisphaeraceae bacterium]